MMKIRVKSFLIPILAMGLLGSCAGMYSGDAIGERRDLMRSNSGNLKAIGAFLKQGKGSAADVASRARKVADNGRRLKGLFPKGTSSADRPGKTRAKPEIWMQMAKFEQAADNLTTLAMKLAAAADTGDKKAIGAAMGMLGKQGCGGCHRAFRGPRPKK